MESHRYKTQPASQQRDDALRHNPIIPDSETDNISHDQARSSSDADGTPGTEESSRTTLISNCVSDNSSSSEKKHRRRYAWITIWWRVTTAALLLTVAAAASFVTLHPYQGHPLPEWPYYITIGALLSIYSVVLRAAATFLLAEGLSQLKWRWYNNDTRPLYDFALHDDAARGPLGAAALLWRLRFLPTTWQWLGCVLLPVTLLIGPFTQQVLQYMPCSVLAGDSIPRFSTPRASVFFGDDDRYRMYMINVAQQASVNAGLYGPGQVSMICDSGNCTASSYTSVGLCAKCEDISSQVSLVFSGNVVDGTANVFTSLPSGLSTNYTLDGQLAAFNRTPTTNNARFWNRDWQVLIGAPGGQQRWGREGCNDATTNQTWRCKGSGAASCKLYPCVRTYGVNIANGIIQERVLDEVDAFGAGRISPVGPQTVYSVIDTSCLLDDERNLLKNWGYSVQSQTRWMPYSAIGTIEKWKEPSAHHYFSDPEEVTILEGKLLSRGCLYATDWGFNFGLQNYIGQQFIGKLTSQSDSSASRLSQFTGNQLLQTIMNYGNFSFEHTRSVFGNISLSVTNHMRMNPVPTAYNTSWPATGDTFTTKTCVKVQWAWLTLPVALATLTLIFFCGVIFTSRHLPREARTWKSSPLPLMFHGPILVPYAEHVHSHDMDVASKGISAKLVMNSIGIPTLEVQQPRKSPKTTLSQV